MHLRLFESARLCDLWQRPPAFQPTQIQHVGMDDDGFVEVKRKHNRSVEVCTDGRGSVAGSEQRQGRGDRRGNARRAGNRRRDTRPEEQLHISKAALQRQDTLSSRSQRSGRYHAHADTKSETRPAKPRGAQLQPAYYAATPSGEPKNGSQRHVDLPSSSAASAGELRQQASERPAPVQPGVMRHSSHAQLRGNTAHQRNAQADADLSGSATAQPVAHGPVLSTQSPSHAAVATPVDRPSIAAESSEQVQFPAKPTSWAARAAQAAPDLSSAPIHSSSSSINSEPRIPGHAQLRVRTRGSLCSPLKSSPVSSTSNARHGHRVAEPQSTAHSSQTSDDPPAQGPHWKAPTTAASPNSHASKGCDVQIASHETSVIDDPAALPMPSMRARETAPAHTLEQTQIPISTSASVDPSGHSRQQSAWNTVPSAASSSPGEFGDELAVLAHSLIDDSHPPGREHACGISNPHSLCFMIAPLQAMLATRPFQALMARLPDLKGSLVVAKRLPVLTGLAELADFIRSPSAAAFDPAPLSKIVEDHNEREGFRGDDSPFSVAKRQPQLDAALLYLHVVDEIHDELDATMKRLGFREQAQEEDDDDGGWNLVGPKKQVREIRETKMASQGRNTPFAMAFRGVLAHHNRNPGKQESINLEPFTLLNVRPEIGVDGRDTVVAGLRRLCSRYRNPETGQEHRSLLAELPPVLVLQVGRFQYQKNSLQKICAPVEHPMQLQLERDMLTQDARRQRTAYNLTAKVVHHGQSMNCGHYTTIALEGPGNWMKYDDGSVTQVSSADAQKPDAYLLFYTVAE
eukprot:jgi/Ulvmu1/7884/UM004_0115.1